jgi:uncharacterized membrane protein required for colicin V production
MSAGWFDLMLAIVLVGIVAIEIRQGMARGLLDTLAAAASLFLAATFALPLSDWLHPGAGGASGSVVTFLVLFGLLMALGCTLGRMVSHLWLHFTPDMFDPMFGALAGMALAVIIGDTLTASLYIYYGDGTPSFLAHSQLAGTLRHLPSFPLVASALSQLRS